MGDFEIKLGDIVLVSKRHRATVRFIGPTNFADGIWYGLELEKEIGESTFTSSFSISSSLYRVD
jgi:dynactin complex subunit